MRLGTYYRHALLRQLGLDTAGGRVLDVGGYDGFWSASLADAETYVLDVDVHPGAPGPRFVRGSGLALPFADGTFDHVFALDVIEHVADDAQLVTEVVRVLRPGGRLVLTTPSDRIRIVPKQLQNWVDRRWGHDRVRGYSAQRLAEIVGACPVSIIDVRPLAISAFRWGYLPLAVAWRASEPVGRALTAAAARRDAGPAGNLGYMLLTATK